MERQVQLVVVSGQEAGKCYCIPEQGATIGRSRTADISLSDEALSRQHCRIFFTDGPVLQDLISSNGTLLNGESVRNEPLPLKEGDVITLGSWVLRVAQITTTQPVATLPVAAPVAAPVVAPVESPTPAVAQSLFGETPAALTSAEPPAAESTVSPNLFGEAEASAEETKPEASKKRLLIVLGACLLLLGLLLPIAWMMETPKEEPPSVRKIVRSAPLAEFNYERLVIDAQHLFRYTLSYQAATNVLMLNVSDLGEADRSFSKRVELSKDAKDTLMKLLWEVDVSKIGEIFPERSHDGISFERRTLTLVRGTEVWQRVAENVSHALFNGICETLEFFARNELQVWAAQYSVAELEAMAEEQLAIADRYWEQRDLGDDKLWQAVVAYRKGLSALETLNPKPKSMVALTQGLQTAEALLGERYEAVLFEVDQALNTQRYDMAIQQLQKILRMIPERDDERHQQASEKLLTVEQRRGKKGGR